MKIVLLNSVLIQGKHNEINSIIEINEKDAKYLINSKFAKEIKEEIKKEIKEEIKENVKIKDNKSIIKKQNKENKEEIRYNINKEN